MHVMVQPEDAMTGGAPGACIAGKDDTGSGAVGVDTLSALRTRCYAQIATRTMLLPYTRRWHGWLL
ncbi:hypothetical protein AYM40_34550 [Paraburkholderia phytofirmans OLGA172]|uniref:Uncharacterized protein n=1 Tax=Paraburkholderia phytofirmans OLGA172 TaxID=1417228 RepID=A0A160FV73_9BURK|nr:hypothetical protein AYM40_34550 [Paraburkholderia phytofirmans OLGA172]